MHLFIYLLVASVATLLPGSNALLPNGGSNQIKISKIVSLNPSDEARALSAGYENDDGKSFLRGAARVKDEDGALHSSVLGRKKSNKSTKKRRSRSEKRDTLDRIKIPPLSMDNTMWNQLLTPVFNEFYAKNIHPSKTSKYLASLKNPETQDKVTMLYIAWHHKRVTGEG